MNRRQLRAIGNYQDRNNQTFVNPDNFPVTPNNAPRDKYTGRYRSDRSGGIIATNWIGRSNSLPKDSKIVVNLSGNQYWGDN